MGGSFTIDILSLKLAFLLILWFWRLDSVWAGTTSVLCFVNAITLTIIHEAFKGCVSGQTVVL
jgi:hypothetical protein